MKIKSIQKIILPEEQQYYDVIGAGPFHNFLIKTNSGYVISHNCNVSDEVNFTAGNLKNVETQKKKLKKMIAQIDARMVSRFGKGTFLPTLNIIISSKDTEQSFLDDYIERKKHDNKTLIIDEPQWVVRTDKGTPNDPGAFYVAVGGKELAHELLPIDASEELVSSYRDKGYQMIKIPPIFRRDFETNLDQALMDIAGISSITAAKFLSGVRLKEAKTTSYENPFTKDVIEVGDAPDDLLQYANFFDLSKIKPEDKSKPLFIHLDMSTGSKGKGDKTGIAGVWITGKTPTIPGQEDSLSLHYKLAFSVSIKAPKGYNISFIKNQNFIKWLREQGFAVKVVSADTYQSMPVLQGLNLAGFKTQIQSVDRVNSEKICEPYYYLKSAIYDRRVDIYDKCDLLTEELTNLEREASGKIEHPEGGKYGSKDQADAFCLDGDTEIFLLSGKHKTIRQLYEENNFKNEWVLGYNTKTETFEPCQIKNVLNNGIKNNIVKIILDNGKELICTDDHKILTRDGKYIKAKEASGISLMPFTHELRTMYKNNKYEYIYVPKNDLSTQGIYLHKLVAEATHGPEKLIAKDRCQKNEWIVVHHADCDKLNNNPENLQYLTNKEHSVIHCQLNSSIEKRNKLSKINKEKFKTYENILKLGFNLYNHRVVKIESLPSREVYDLQLDKIHNFALTNGLIVHNCGALFDASKFAEEYAYNYGESLTLALDSNFEESATSKEELRKQLTVSFQEEIAKLYMEKAHCDEIAAKQKQEEIQRLNEIKDGIIVL